MNTAAEKRTTYRDSMSPSEMLNTILEQPVSARHKAIDDNLQSRIEKIEELLPPNMKGQGARLAKRAMLTFARTPDLQQCPPADFIRCVLEAAELGLAIDGKLAYVVKYKSTWQMQPSYIGLIAACRRTGRIADIYGDVVCENDNFQHLRQDGRSMLTHTYDLGQPRGNVIGAYAVVIMPNGSWRYELLDRSELDRIQDRAPAKNGPWKTDVNEMRKKTAFRRCLKLYCDDPGLAKAIEALERFDEEHEPRERIRHTRRSSIIDTLPVASASEYVPSFQPPTHEEEAAILKQEREMGDAYEGA